jgi:hypothetical protein
MVILGRLIGNWVIRRRLGSEVKTSGVSGRHIKNITLDV